MSNSIEDDLKRVWSDHLRGNSASAAIVACATLFVIDTQEFDNLKVAENHGEWARIVVVASLAAAKKEEVWKDVKGHIFRAIRAVAVAYPLAENQEEAQKRGNYWQVVYGNESAQLMCLRDVLHLFRFLNKLIPRDDIQNYIHGLFNLLSSLTKTEELREERFSLIFQIEEGDYDDAKEAYDTFVDIYGEGRDLYSAEQHVTVSAKMRSKADEHQDTDLISRIDEYLAAILQQNQELEEFISEQKRKYSTVEIANGNDKVEAWQQKISAGDELMQPIEALMAMTWVGLGEGRVEGIQI